MAPRAKYSSNVRTRRAAHMERYVRVRTIELDPPLEPLHKVSLAIDHHSFALSDGTGENFESLEKAEWYRDMLCIALDRMVKAETALVERRTFHAAAGLICPGCADAHEMLQREGVQMLFHVHPETERTYPCNAYKIWRREQ